jgi:hypothetical protein
LKIYVAHEQNNKYEEEFELTKEIRSAIRVPFEIDDRHNAWIFEYF